MGTTLFDTTTVPQWRTTGVVELTNTASLRAGDPCYGHLPTIAGVELTPGEWVWEVRDADETGGRAHRVWEVRLRRQDVAAADHWEWDDDFGQWAQVPAPGASVVEDRGVDAGTMAWQVVGADTEHLEIDVEALLWSRTNGTPQHCGTVLVTSTGWGDGCYPIGVRREGDTVVEVRMAFITPDPDPLTAAQFVELLPAALSQSDYSGAPAVTVAPGEVTIRVSRTRYTAARDGDRDQLETTTYDTVVAVHVPATGRTFASTITADEGSYAPDAVRAVAHLWTRLPVSERAALTVAEDIGEQEIVEPSGYIVESTRTQVGISILI